MTRALQLLQPCQAAGARLRHECRAAAARPHWPPPAAQHAARRLRHAAAAAEPVPAEPPPAAARRSPRTRVPTQLREAARREVVCADALQWLAQQRDLPCVVTSLPDVTELSGPPLHISTPEEYARFFSSTVATIVSKLRAGCVAIIYVTDTLRDGHFIDKSYLASAGAAAAGGRALWHKVALRQDVGTVRFGKLPAFTHMLAFASPAGGLTRAQSGAFGVPDVFHRGDVEWSKASAYPRKDTHCACSLAAETLTCAPCALHSAAAVGVDAAVWACRFLRDDIVRRLRRPAAAPATSLLRC